VANRVATVLVAGNSLFREGLLLILSTTAFRVCKVAATIDDLSLQSIPISRPVLFLIGAEGAHAGTTALAVGRVREHNSSARIVVLGDRCELNDALAVFRAGADGYLFEQISRDALIKSLDLVMLGVTVLPAAIMRVVGEEHEMVSQDNPAVPAAQTDVSTFDYMPRKLSHREMGILHCLMQGEPNKTIARQFDITEATVKVHIKAILRKICVRNRTQAAVWAHNHASGLTNTIHGPIANGSSGCGDDCVKSSTSSQGRRLNSFELRS
jgi:two-component system, NarL family, nitrate/nitrite response regulator NarL